MTIRTCDDGLRVSNGSVAANIRPTEGVLESVEDVATGVGFRPGSEGAPLWRTSFRDATAREAAVTPDDATETTCRIEDEAVVLGWTVPLGMGADPAHVEVTLRVPPDEANIWLEPSVDVPAETTLWSFTCPVMPDLCRVEGDRSEDRLVFPTGWGVEVADPLGNPDAADFHDVPYPTAGCPMQFLGFANGDAGLYVGCHDPRGRPKTVTAAPTDGALTVEIEHHPPGRGTSQGRYDPGYPVVIGTYDGDWYDVAERYREWALAEASWTDSNPLIDRSDVPAWLRERALWWLLAPGERPISDDVNLVERLAEAFPVPTAVHWYPWRRAPFDVDYPDYFPPREGWVEAVVDCEATGVRVVPYLNARLADPNSDEWQPRNLSEAVATRASARLDSTSLPRTETYDDQLMHPMCPATARWRETCADAVRRLAGTGASGVYLDQLAAYRPPRCFDADHDHSQGDGASGVAGYRTLLSELLDWKQTHAPELALTSENNAEPYMDGLHAHLLWNSARSDLVPLYSVVYGEYALAFGRQFFTTDLDDSAAFRSKIGQLFSFGAQLGWLHHDVAERLLDEAHESEAAYLLGAARALERGREFVVLGRRLRDPEVHPKPPTVDVEWEMYRHGRWTVSLPAALVALWAHPTEEAFALAATNWHGGDRDLEVSLPDGEYRVEPLVADEHATFERTDEGPRLSLSLPADATRVIRLDAQH